MASHRILAVAHLSKPHRKGMWMIVNGFHARDIGQFADSKTLHDRNVEPADGTSRVNPGISPAIAEFGGIGLFPDSSRVGDDQEDTLKFVFHI